jgi:hypothetical protein
MGKLNAWLLLTSSLSKVVSTYYCFDYFLKSLRQYLPRYGERKFDNVLFFPNNMKFPARETAVVR